MRRVSGVSWCWRCCWTHPTSTWARTSRCVSGSIYFVVVVAVALCVACTAALCVWCSCSGVAVATQQGTWSWLGIYTHTYARPHAHSHTHTHTDTHTHTHTCRGSMLDLMNILGALYCTTVFLVRDYAWTRMHVCVCVSLCACTCTLMCCVGTVQRCSWLCLQRLCIFKRVHITAAWHLTLCGWVCDMQ